jgi:hypothetical protein
MEAGTILIAIVSLSSQKNSVIFCCQVSERIVLKKVG